MEVQLKALIVQWFSELKSVGWVQQRIQTVFNPNPPSRNSTYILRWYIHFKNIGNIGHKKITTGLDCWMMTAFE